MLPGPQPGGLGKHGRDPEAGRGAHCAADLVRKSRQVRHLFWSLPGHLARRGSWLRSRVGSFSLRGAGMTTRTQCSWSATELATLTTQWLQGLPVATIASDL